MPAPSQTVFDGFQSCRHPIPAGLSYQHEPAVAIFPADVREPEEVERFWFAFSPDGTVFGSEAAELHQTGFLRVNRESELPQSALHGYTEAPGIVSFVEPDDDVIGVTRPLTALMRPPITFPESSSSATAMMYPGCGILPSSPTSNETTRSLLLVRIPQRPFRFASDCLVQPMAVISS